MKRLLFLFAAVVLALTASAANPLKLKSAIKHQVKFGSAITEQPAGELKTYKRTGGTSFVFSSSNGLSVTSQSGDAEIVFGEGNKVWLKDPIYGLAIGSWVEGTLSSDGTTITVPMGQTLYTDEEANADLNLANVHIDISAPDEQGSSTVTVTPNEEVKAMTYTIQGNVITLNGTEGDSQLSTPCDITALCAVWSDDNKWQGFADWNTVLTEKVIIPAPDMITEQPEGELHTYNRTGESWTYSSWYGLYTTVQSGKAYIVYGKDGNVYLQDPIFSAVTGNWVKGKLSADGKTITVPMDQYIYWSEEEGYGLILKNTTVNVSASGSVSMTVNDVKEMTYSIDGETITLNGTDGDMNADYPMATTGLCAVWSDDLTFSGYQDWNTVYNEVILKPAVPANPDFDSAFTGVDVPWYDRGDEQGYNKFYYHINLVDIDGKPLDPDYVSYSIFTDDNKLFTYDAKSYTWDIDEDMTEVPYNFGGFDITNTKSYMYRTNAEGYEPFFTRRIGIQVYYTVDGIKNASDIVYWTLDGTIEVEDANTSGVVQFKGTVLDNETKLPIEGAEVKFLGATPQKEGESTPMEELTATTDANGNFTLKVRPEVIYIANYSKDGYHTKVMAHKTADKGAQMETIYLKKDATTGINELNSDNVKNVNYINAAGVMSKTPFKGMNIKVVEYADGSKKAVKVLK